MKDKTKGLPRLDLALSSLFASNAPASDFVDAISVRQEADDASSLPEKKPTSFVSFLNFLSTGEVETKDAMRRENGIDFPARDYAYVPDPTKPTTWKLRLTETPGKVSIAQLGRAAAALSPGGFRGNRVSIPQSAISAAKRRIRAEYRKLSVRDADIPASVKEGNQFAVWKQVDGTLRWFAVYSNNFRDDDYPPEIISEKSHELFIAMADSGVVPMPELWHWHIPGTRWGVADWLGYDSGFALASGTVDQGHEKEAIALASMDEIGVSHGMRGNTVVYDDNDPSVIIIHTTHEISPLPLRAAANKMTGFVILDTVEKENNVLTPDKRDHLIKLGLQEDQIDALEGSLKSASNAALGLGLESKEVEQVAAAKVEDVAEVTEEVPVVVTEAAPAEVTEPVKETADYVTTKEVADAIGVLIESFGSTIKEQSVVIAQLNERVAGLESSVKELSVSDGQKAAKAAMETPRASLADLIGQSISASKEAIVDGRSSLAKSKPAETKVDTARVTGIPMLDALLATSQRAEVNE